MQMNLPELSVPFVLAFFLIRCVRAAAGLAALRILCRARSDQFSEEKLELTSSGSVPLRRESTGSFAGFLSFVRSE